MTEADRSEIALPDFETLSNQEIVDFFKQKPLLGELFEADSGVWQDYTVEEHTLMVMRQFDRYFSDSFSSPLLSRGEFRVMLALHDIGKGQAVKELGKDEGRKRQHEYTEKIIPETISELGFDESTISLIGSLPIHGLMGEYMKKHKDADRDSKVIPVSTEAASHGFYLEAQRLGIGPHELFYLAKIYFISDAASYTHDADPGMGSPPPGRESLDHLFNFEREIGNEKGRIEFKPDLKTRIDELEKAISSS
jgi:hypothetical protein